MVGGVPLWMIAMVMAGLAPLAVRALVESRLNATRKRTAQMLERARRDARS